MDKDKIRAICLIAMMGIVDQSIMDFMKHDEFLSYASDYSQMDFDEWLPYSGEFHDMTLSLINEFIKEGMKVLTSEK